MRNMLSVSKEDILYEQHQFLHREGKGLYQEQMPSALPYEAPVTQFRSVLPHLLERPWPISGALVVKGTLHIDLGKQDEISEFR